MDLKDLHRQGYSIRQIAKATGFSRNTVRRRLGEKVPSEYDCSGRVSRLDPFKNYVRERFEECGLSAVRLLVEVRAMGYEGSVDTLRRYVATLRPRSLALQKATVRFETAPGQQGQADWAYCGRYVDGFGKTASIYAFVFVLGFSRALYVRFTTSMDVFALMDCHKRAFAYFGGWPREVLYDNMKQVKLGPDEWNAAFIDFAGHYGFTPRTCRIRRARTKGKVERMVLYVKDNFLNGRTFRDLDDLNAEAIFWLDGTANVRVHATTGRRPADLLPQEGLTPIAAIAPYNIVAAKSVKVDAESFVRHGGSRYMVHPAHIGRTVTVVEKDRRIIVRADNLIVAEHDRAATPGSQVTNNEFLAELWKASLASHDGPLPRWQMAFTADVAATPLSSYDACVAEAAR